MAPTTPQRIDTRRIRNRTGNRSGHIRKPSAASATPENFRRQARDAIAKSRPKSSPSRFDTSLSTSGGANIRRSPVVNDSEDDEAEHDRNRGSLAAAGNDESDEEEIRDCIIVGGSNASNRSSVDAVETPAGGTHVVLKEPHERHSFPYEMAEQLDSDFNRSTATTADSAFVADASTSVVFRFSNGMTVPNTYAFLKRHVDELHRIVRNDSNEIWEAKPKLETEAQHVYATLGAVASGLEAVQDVLDPVVGQSNVSGMGEDRQEHPHAQSGL
jgi:hypothetical protein